MTFGKDHNINSHNHVGLMVTAKQSWAIINTAGHIELVSEPSPYAGHVAQLIEQDRLQEIGTRPAPQ